MGSYKLEYVHKNRILKTYYVFYQGKEVLSTLYLKDQNKIDLSLRGYGHVIVDLNTNVEVYRK